MQVDIQNDGPVTIQLDSVTKGKVRNVAFRAVTFLLCIFVFNQLPVTLRKYLGREILNRDNILSLLSFGKPVRLFLNFLSHQRKLNFF